MSRSLTDGDFLRSAREVDSGVFPLDGFESWFRAGRERHRFRIDPIPFAELRKWSFAPESGNLVHDSGKFFSIEGVAVRTDFGRVAEWSQPIINQPEVGFLGILTKRFGGVPHFLMQAKMEPGNINMIQLSPTLQATRSNYTRVHKGRTPPFLEYFRKADRKKVLVDVLQSEQGGRFLQKRNRNMVVELPEEETIGNSESHIWLTLGQITRLLKQDNVVNMDARTVLSCLPLHREEDSEWQNRSRHSDDEIRVWFTNQKCRYELNAERRPLAGLSGWRQDDRRIHREDERAFEVIAVEVEAANREVPSWTQPIVKPYGQGLFAFLCRYFNGTLHFLVQGKVEAGNFDTLELAPTVQYIEGEEPDVDGRVNPHFLEDVLSADPERVLFDTLQSEEGGRFYREENRNMLVLADDELTEEHPENFMWVSFGQMKELMRFSNVLNIQCRCLLSAVTPDWIHQES